MKERPILFSGEMVRAILEDRKTQTRRVINPKMWPALEEILQVNGYIPLSMMDYDIVSPYGRPGDRLWVRETWARYRAFGEDTKIGAPIIYRADRDYCDQYPCMLNGQEVYVGQRNPWKPSIHMPRWASRINLEITDIRVERLQSISAEDIIAEGLSTKLREHEAVMELRDKFKKLWNSINSKRGFGWDSNPWVWVVEFRRVK